MRRNVQTLENPIEWKDADIETLKKLIFILDKYGDYSMLDADDDCSAYLATWLYYNSVYTPTAQKAIKLFETLVSNIE